uniref:Uncharacterized protein n=1 Tax=Rhizophagus irregularis (strain DAOM 181602 / DAOM 197198 / MUCL 43194) TaxID=747089 RepID=U9SIY7_RHIID
MSYNNKEKRIYNKKKKKNEGEVKEIKGKRSSGNEKNEKNEGETKWSKGK